MSAAIVLILLAEAATSCAPARGIELPGGATIVRPVGTSQPAPFEPLGPAPGLPKSDFIQQTSAAGDPDGPGDEPAPQQCEVAPVQMV
jgi:hypothetical protein